MPQTVRIPLSEFNVTPLGVEFEDVVWSVPTLDDIREAILAETLDRTDIDELLAEWVDDVVDEIEDAVDGIVLDAETVRDEIEEAIAQGVIDSEDIVDALVRAIEENVDLGSFVGPDVNISGIFGPLSRDIIEAFEAILEDVGEDVARLNKLIDELLAAIDDPSAVFEGLEDVSAENIQTWIDEIVSDVLEAFFGFPFGMDLDEWLRQFIDDFTGGIVSEEARQDLATAIDELGSWLS